MNATVTLPLSEIDALRTKLKNAEDRATELEEKKRLMQVEVTEIKAYDAYGSGLIGGGRFDSRPQKTQTLVTTWKNLEDVLEPLRLEAEKKVEQTVQGLRNKIDRFSRQIDSHSSHIDSLIDEKNKQHKVIEELNQQVEELKKTNPNEQLQAQIDTLHVEKFKMNIAVQAAETKFKELKARYNKRIFHFFEAIGF